MPQKLLQLSPEIHLPDLAEDMHLYNANVLHARGLSINLRQIYRPHTIALSPPAQIFPRELGTDLLAQNTEFSHSEAYSKKGGKYREHIMRTPQWQLPFETKEVLPPVSKSARQSATLHE
jgi:hypothetical protein